MLLLLSLALAESPRPTVGVGVYGGLSSANVFWLPSPVETQFSGGESAGISLELVRHHHDLGFFVQGGYSSYEGGVLEGGLRGSICRHLCFTGEPLALKVATRAGMERLVPLVGLGADWRASSRWRWGSSPKWDWDLPGKTDSGGIPPTRWISRSAPATSSISSFALGKVTSSVGVSPGASSF